ncbi:unnamed protein product [Durusdinium trenchii]|uniref:Uncharacterized protein n=2 Tax=Durusdinium trenchii TaxID=1381693 RepID=A0ABP0JL38_9DINO
MARFALAAFVAIRLWAQDQSVCQEDVDDVMSCGNLVDISNITHEIQDVFKASRDLRDHFWPAPWRVSLFDEKEQYHNALVDIHPLIIDPCATPFKLTKIRRRGPELLDAVIWTLRHFCWRACRRAAEERCGQTSEENECENSKNWHQLEAVNLDIEGATVTMPGLDMDESYELTVSVASELHAKSIHGFRRGMETLLQIFDALRSDGSKKGATWSWAPGVLDGKVLTLRINDDARFPWRGILLDTARHFIPVEVITSLLWAMAANKLNVLHWHLTDAVSFPLELDSLPKLAELGALSQTYSKAMVKQLIEQAANLSIRIVPELDMPAHTASWIFGEPSSVSNCTHVLPDDPKEAKNIYKARDKLALDISSPRSREVAKMVLAEVAALFPDEFLHVGGDEVDYRCWTTMPHIRKWMKKHGFGPLEALQDFFDEIWAEVQKHGKRPVIWEDSFDQGLRLPIGAVVQPWKCWGNVSLRFQPKAPPAMLGHASAFVAVKKNLSVVQSSCWYLDWSSEWMDFYEHAADEGPLQNEPSKRLLGGEAALWSERMDFSNLACRAWPRSAALAERLWSNTSVGFAAQAQRHPKVDQRLRLHTRRLQRLHKLPLRPLRPEDGKAMEIQDDFEHLETTCPLLPSQAIQRNPRSAEWASVIAKWSGPGPLRLTSGGRRRRFANANAARQRSARGGRGRCDVGHLWPSLELDV